MTPAQTAPAADETLHAYSATLKNQDGFIYEDSPLRPRKARMPLAALIVGFLTTATLFAGIGFAIGSAITAA